MGKKKHVKAERSGCWQGDVDKKFKSNLGKLLVVVLVVLDPLPYHCSQFCLSCMLCS